ncbi:MAG: hypothetical protein CYPHOPRED_003430 [Cyphobasidiales sp. Tagirdzhanova-0007]|nr:MAG: hypothetical protein CYPHOPRED_003430 [Cyphobasidiales sp. Tagirdzhanova-0007]
MGTADLLRRHAGRHDMRERHGYDLHLKPGPIKGVFRQKKLQSIRSLDINMPSTYATASICLSDDSTALHQTTSTSVDSYDNEYFAQLLTPHEWLTSASSELTPSFVDRNLSRPSGLKDFDKPLAGSPSQHDLHTPFLSSTESNWFFRNADLMSDNFFVPLSSSPTRDAVTTASRMDDAYPSGPRSQDGSGNSPREEDHVMPQKFSWTPRVTVAAIARVRGYLTVIAPNRSEILPTKIGAFQDIPQFLSDSLFSLTDLETYLTLFFKWDMSQYSIIHRGTFDPDKCNAPLLCALTAIGCHFAMSEVDMRAEKLLNEDSVTGIQASSACLLINLYGRTMSTKEDHEMAHILYPSIITLFKRSALWTAPKISVSNDADLIEQWQAWITEEASKRAAFMAYQFDILCSALFKEMASLSAFQIQLSLPSNEDEWHAVNASEWDRLHKAAPIPPPFLSTIKAFLMPGLNTPVLSPLARVICLHGLLSVAFDMQWREYFLLGLSTHPDGLVKEWRSTLTSAYNYWKRHFDTALTSAPTAIGTQLLRNAIPIYAVAHCSSTVDVVEFQIFAGAQTALGVPVAPSTIEATRRHIISWSSAKGREAAWHAAHFLRSALYTHRNAESGNVHPSYYTWCLYIACLCLYAYSRATTLVRMNTPAPREGSSGDALKYLDLICATSPDATRPANVTNSLQVCGLVLEIMRRDTKWELAQDGSRLLAELVNEAGVRASQA